MGLISCMYCMCVPIHPTATCPFNLFPFSIFSPFQSYLSIYSPFVLVSLCKFCSLCKFYLFPFLSFLYCLSHFYIYSTCFLCIVFLCSLPFPSLFVYFPLCILYSTLQYTIQSPYIFICVLYFIPPYEYTIILFLN